MMVGVPEEIKEHESRAGMLPIGVEELVRAGHRVLVQKSAGLGSGIRDADYQRSGATLVEEAREIWERADLVVESAVAGSHDIASAVNIHGGKVTPPAVAETFGLPCTLFRWRVQFGQRCRSN